MKKYDSTKNLENPDTIRSPSNGIEEEESSTILEATIGKSKSRKRNSLGEQLGDPVEKGLELEHNRINTKGRHYNKATINEEKGKIHSRRVSRAKPGRDVLHEKRQKLLDFLGEEKQLREKMSALHEKYLVSCSIWNKVKCSNVENLEQGGHPVSLITDIAMPSLAPAFPEDLNLSPLMVDDFLYTWNAMAQYASVLRLPTIPNLQQWINIVMLVDGSAADGNGRLNDQSQGSILAAVHISLTKILLKEYFNSLEINLTLREFGLTRPINIFTWPEIARICCHLAAEKYNFSGDNTAIRDIRGTKTSKYDIIVNPIREDLQSRGIDLLQGKRSAIGHHKAAAENLEREDTDNNLGCHGMFHLLVESGDLDFTVDSDGRVTSSRNAVVSPGNFLLFVNGKKVKEEVIEQLAHIARPLGICFSKSLSPDKISSPFYVKKTGDFGIPHLVKRCLQVLSILRSKEIAIPFNSPVNLELYPDYADVVSDPIDLGTIVERLEIGDYEDDEDSIIESVSEDVGLVWQNCYAYNSENAPISQSAKSLSAAFDRLMEEFIFSSYPRSLDNISEEFCRNCKHAFCKELLLFCNRCGGGYHHFCLSPPLMSLPEGEWYCSKCLSSDSFTAPKEGEREDDDLEEDDISKLSSLDEEYFRIGQAISLLSKDSYSDLALDERLHLLRVLFELLQNSSIVEQEIAITEDAARQVRDDFQDGESLMEIKRQWDHFRPPKMHNYRRTEKIQIQGHEYWLTDKLVEFLIENVNIGTEDGDLEYMLSKFGRPNKPAGSHTIEEVDSDTSNTLCEDKFSDCSTNSYLSDSEDDEESLLEENLELYKIEHKDTDSLYLCTFCGFGELNIDNYCIHRCIRSPIRGLFPVPELHRPSIMSGDNSPLSILKVDNFPHDRRIPFNLKQVQGMLCIWPNDNNVKLNDSQLDNFGNLNAYDAFIGSLVYSMNETTVLNMSIDEFSSEWEKKVATKEGFYLYLFDPNKPIKIGKHEHLPPDIRSLTIKITSIAKEEGLNLKVDKGYDGDLQFVEKQNGFPKGAFVFSVNDSTSIKGEKEFYKLLKSSVGTSYVCTCEARPLLDIQNELESSLNLQSRVLEAICLERQRNYTVRFGPGPLGMGLAFDGDTKKAVVRSFNQSTSDLQGQAAASGKIELGDLIVGINGKPYDAVLLTDFTTSLLKTPRPLVLNFVRPLANDQSVEVKVVKVHEFPVGCELSFKNGRLTITKSTIAGVGVGDVVIALNGKPLPPLGVAYFKYLLKIASKNSSVQLFFQSCSTVEKTAGCRLAWAHLPCIKEYEEASASAKDIIRRLKLATYVENFLLCAVPRILPLGACAAGNLYFQFLGDVEKLYIKTPTAWLFCAGKKGLNSILRHLQQTSSSNTLVLNISERYHRLLHISTPRASKTIVQSMPPLQVKADINFSIVENQYQKNRYYDLAIPDCCEFSNAQLLNTGPMSIRKCVYHDLSEMQWKIWMVVYGRRYLVGSFSSLSEAESAYERAVSNFVSIGSHLSPFLGSTFPCARPPVMKFSRTFRRFYRFYEGIHPRNRVTFSLLENIRRGLSENFQERSAVSRAPSLKKNLSLNGSSAEQSSFIQRAIHSMAELGKKLVSAWGQFCQSPTMNTVSAMAVSSSVGFDSVRKTLLELARSPKNAPHPRTFVAVYHTFVVGCIATVTATAMKSSTISQQNARLMKAVVDAYAVALLAAMEPSDSNIEKAYECFAIVEASCKSNCENATGAVRVVSMSVLHFFNVSRYNDASVSAEYRSVLPLDPRQTHTNPLLLQQFLLLTQAKDTYCQRSLAKQQDAQVKVDVKFLSGPLGIVINQVDNGSVVVGRFSSDQNGNIGQAQESGKVSIGDLVIAVNGKSINEIGIEGFRTAVKNEMRPLTVTFLKPISLEASTDIGASRNKSPSASPVAETKDNNVEIRTEGSSKIAGSPSVLSNGSLMQAENTVKSSIGDGEVLREKLEPHKSEASLGKDEKNCLIDVSKSARRSTRVLPKKGDEKIDGAILSTSITLNEIIDTSEPTDGTQGQLATELLDNYLSAIAMPSPDTCQSLVVLRSYLLQLEACIPRDSFRRGYWSKRIRAAWAEVVSIADSSERLLEAIIFLESSLDADSFEQIWRSSPLQTARHALENATMASTAMRLFALDQCLLYSRKNHNKRKSKGGSKYEPPAPSAKLKRLFVANCKYLNQLPPELLDSGSLMMENLVLLCQAKNKEESRRRDKGEALCHRVIGMEYKHAMMEATGLSCKEVEDWMEFALKDIPYITVVPSKLTIDTKSSLDDNEEDDQKRVRNQKSTKRKASPKTQPSKPRIKRQKTHEHGFQCRKSGYPVPTGGDKKTSLNSRLLHLLSKLMENPSSSLFNEAVDPSIVKGYDEVIKHPMDLGTVKSRLLSGFYDKDISLFPNDVNQVWKNCLLFNESGSEICKMVKRLSSVFDRLFEQFISEAPADAKVSDLLKEDQCRVCKHATNVSEMLICDSCEASYHMTCLSPPLTLVPSGDWYCPRCPILET